MYWIRGLVRVDDRSLQSPLDLGTGYTFCVELMPPDHELQLMLVNTLRKVSTAEYLDVNI